MKELSDAYDREQIIEDMLRNDEEQKVREEQKEARKENPNEAKTIELSLAMAKLKACQETLLGIDFMNCETAIQHLSKITNIVNEKLKEKLHARHQSLITQFLTKKKCLL